VSLAEFINSIDFPILVVASGAVVLEANRAATRVLKRDLSAMRQALTGVAINCFNADLPGGCGHTEHCSGCVLRRAILDTQADGCPRYGVYSDHHVAGEREMRSVHFRFSTSKLDGMLVVAIEDTGELVPKTDPRPQTRPGSPEAGGAAA